MNEEVRWKVIEEFPNYEVSDRGDVVNRTTGRLMQQSHTQAGQVKVGLVGEDGKQKSRSVKVLVAEAFVDGKSATYDTPINLDGNPENNNASNIKWRPRWFALRWMRQYTEIANGEYEFYFVKPVYCINQKEYYDHMHHAAVVNGTLPWEVFLSVHNIQRTWPDGLQFRFVEDHRLGEIGTPEEYIYI